MGREEEELLEEAEKRVFNHMHRNCKEKSSKIIGKGAKKKKKKHHHVPTNSSSLLEFLY